MPTDEQEADWEVASEDTEAVALMLEFILWSSNGGRTILLLSGCCFMVVLYFGATIFTESSLFNVIIGLIFAMADSLFGFGRVSRLLYVRCLYSILMFGSGSSVVLLVQVPRNFYAKFNACLFLA